MKRQVGLKLDVALVDRIDQARGDVARSVWIALACEYGLAGVFETGWLLRQARAAAAAGLLAENLGEDRVVLKPVPLLSGFGDGRASSAY